MLNRWAVRAWLAWERWWGEWLGLAIALLVARLLWDWIGGMK